jgi:hypothetical protein
VKLPFARRRYRIVLHGTGILIPDVEGEDPIIGFRAVRHIRAASPQEATLVAVARLRNAWFSSPWSTANKTGGPTVTVEKVEIEKSLLTRSRPNRGYDFYRHVPPREADARETAPPGGVEGAAARPFRFKGIVLALVLVVAAGVAVWLEYRRETYPVPRDGVVRSVVRALTGGEAPP